MLRYGHTAALTVCVWLLNLWRLSANVPLAQYGAGGNERSLARSSQSRTVCDADSFVLLFADQRGLLHCHPVGRYINKQSYRGGMIGPFFLSNKYFISG